MVMVGVDGNSLQVNLQPNFADWFDLRVGSRKLNSAIARPL